jgi:hypothetical protein
MKKTLALFVVFLTTLLSFARVDIHPQSFDAGGWSIDVQFMDVMGSPYLIAHGRGIRCLDATAVANIPKEGKWRIYVRSRKWVDGAGAFKVKVNGKGLDKKFGVSQSEWAWEDGGSIDLPKGEVKVALVDLDGFDGRCAGISFVKDGEAPKGPLCITKAEVAETIEVDFAVVGGGLPGVCAALAAARGGMKTALIQDRPILGGNSSSEIRVWSAGEARYDLVREVRGWFMNRDADMKLSDDYRMRLVQDEANMTLLVSTRAFATEKNPNGSISAVKALDWKRNRIVRIKAKLFCDATGDGWIGYWAGADYRMGREASSEHNETYAPEKADSHTLGASLMWTSSQANTDIPFSAPWAEPYACGEKAINGEWNWEYGIRNNVIEQGEHVRDRLLLAIYGAFSLAKKESKYSRRVLNFLPFILGKRESRRIMGDWIFSETDITKKRQFEDGIATGSWSIDLHYDDCKKGVDFLTTCRQPLYGRYYIPYRSIYSRNIPNLFMAGRCFSCTHVGLASPRVVNTLAQLGVAAGEAAVLCKKYGCSPRDIYKKGYYRELQSKLGGEFPGRPDPTQATWKIIDNEMSSVKFEGSWGSSKCHNGEQVGDKASYPGKGAVAAIYPLPVEKAGSYSIKMRVPYLWKVSVPSKTVFEVVSDNQTYEIEVDQTVEMGLWREIAVLDLAPGAYLRLNVSKSKGTIIADGFAIAPVK